MNKNLVIASIIGLLVIVAAAVFMNMPDNRTAGERVGDAVDTLPQGVDKAAEQLEDRTPAERLGDNIKEGAETTEQKAEDATDGNPAT
ncbi:hypothetical protein Q1W73_05475 [Asticcacaulis sp. ZE23SCel15]|jgi:hypothetical protein|uniref:hypothetical protein n=1 Tax=Asticcacaulis sp. ZE23SCel15 TaxID=3059027 RepID=UPI00265E2647|nr:hypothetical protein [Asticcacaulis sp. ZE23SCel15]WKL58436.1 hypothetical protein Q1W73_05475 [Asticcacaulis sp. ZE23SCel15]